MLVSEAEIFIKRLGDFPSPNWERPYSVVRGWVRTPLSSAILWLHCCVCGSRTKWRSLGIVDGPSLPLMVLD